jgi:hypothetical protein
MGCIFLMFLDHTQRRSTVGRTPLGERSARRRDLCLTTHDTHNRQISMPPVGVEPTISVGERPLIARPEESYRLCCVVVYDLETSRMCTPYTYDFRSLRVKHSFTNIGKNTETVLPFHSLLNTGRMNLRFVVPCIFNHSNETTN